VLFPVSPILPSVLSTESVETRNKLASPACLTRTIKKIPSPFLSRGFSVHVGFPAAVLHLCRFERFSPFLPLFIPRPDPVIKCPLLGSTPFTNNMRIPLSFAFALSLRPLSEPAPTADQKNSDPQTPGKKDPADPSPGATRQYFRTEPLAHNVFSALLQTHQPFPKFSNIRPFCHRENFAHHDRTLLALFSKTLLFLAAPYDFRILGFSAENLFVPQPFVLGYPSSELLKPPANPPFSTFGRALNRTSSLLSYIPLVRQTETFSPPTIPTPVPLPPVSPTVPTKQRP